MKTILAALLVLFPAIASAHSGFEGRWRINTVDVADPTSEWSQEKDLPSSIEVKSEKNRLVALFTDRSGTTLSCMSFDEIIEGHEAILFGCPAPYKSSEALSPLHRMKLQGKLLRSFTVTDKLIYTWSAAREPK